MATDSLNRIEAPVTAKAVSCRLISICGQTAWNPADALSGCLQYFMCAFAAFGGIFFGYDSGYINGVTGSAYFIREIEGPMGKALSSAHQSTIVSVLSAGTFFGAIMAGDLADFFGRRFTIILGCFVFTVGVILQIASSGLGLIVAGRLVAGFGIGFVSAIIM